MKMVLLLLSLIFSVNTFASNAIDVGSEVLMNFNYGLGCLGTVTAKTQDSYVIKFESYTAPDGEMADNCHRLGEEVVTLDQIELAVPTKKVEWGGIFGFWGTQFKVGDTVLTKRSYKFCVGKIENIVNSYAKVSVDYSQYGCGLMKNYFIHLDDVVPVKHQI